MVRLTILIFPLYSVLLAPSGLLRKTDEKYGNLIIHLSGNHIHPDIRLQYSTKIATFWQKNIKKNQDSYRFCL